MKHLYFVLIFILLLAINSTSRAAYSPFKMVTYTPVPMRSTSSMLPQEQKSSSWDKPGIWTDPYSDEEDDEGGGGGSDIPKPGVWVDPYWSPDEESEEVPIGSEFWLVCFVGLYAARLVKRRTIQRQSSAKPTKN